MRPINKISDKDLYNIDAVLSENKINRDAFFGIMRLLGITDRIKEFKILQYIVHLNPYQIEKISEDVLRIKMSKMQKESKKHY